MVPFWYIWKLPFLSRSKFTRPSEVLSCFVVNPDCETLVGRYRIPTRHFWHNTFARYHSPGMGPCSIHFWSGSHHRRSSETSGRYGCDSNLCNCSRKPFCRLDHNQFLYSFVHNTADVHSLDFAAHCTPFHPATSPSTNRH